MAANSGALRIILSSLDADDDNGVEVNPEDITDHGDLGCISTVTVDGEEYLLMLSAP